MVVGNIYRITRWAAVGVDPPAYGVAVDDNSLEVLHGGPFLADAEGMSFAHYWSAVDDSYDGSGWTVDRDDTVEIVPEDEVPDEVWTALAVYRLTGSVS